MAGDKDLLDGIRILAIVAVVIWALSDCSSDCSGRGVTDSKSTDSKSWEDLEHF